MDGVVPFSHKRPNTGLGHLGRLQTLFAGEEEAAGAAREAARD
jgi:hypothetical protein